MEQLKTPVLFLIFNRPDLTEIVFERIREVKPKYLFIAADGARDGNESDQLKCQQSRELATNLIDWECEVKTLFREKNLGCGKAVSEAITWFFSQVEEGIILEDDTLPSISFFNFCTEILNKYRGDKRIMSVTGLNWQDGIKRGNASYYFSMYPGIWGWATWRDRWSKYKFNLEDDEISNISENLKAYNLKKREIKHHISTFRDSRNVDTWDFQWKFAVFRNNGLCVIPNRNLISNIGWGDEATHTKNANHWRANRQIFDLDGKIIHPTKIIRNIKADSYLSKKMGFHIRESKNQIFSGILSKRIFSI